MTCVDFERLIALDVEGDLPRQGAGKLADHLRVCAQCRQFAEKLQDSQALLKELRHETPDTAELQNVRRRILNRLPVEPLPTALPLWQFAVGAGMAAVLITAMIMFNHPSRTPSPRLVAKSEAPAAGRIAGAVREPALRTVDGGDGPMEHMQTSRASAKAAVPLRTAAAKARESRPNQRDLQFSQARAQAQSSEPLTVKLITHNPNVVIYWQVD
jgi:hypothetical protein